MPRLTHNRFLPNPLQLIKHPTTLNDDDKDSRLKIFFVWMCRKSVFWYDRGAMQQVFRISLAVRTKQGAKTVIEVIFLNEDCALSRR
jgi:hypothetical protein